MNTKIVLVSAAVAGAAAIGLPLAGPALAAAGAPTAGAAVTTRVDRITQALAGLVSDGTLTQAQADQVATTLDGADLGRGPGGRGGHGGPGRGPDISAAATALGVSEAELRTALQGGKTLAQVATDKGVSVDTLVAALVKAEQDRLAQAVTDGRLTQAQADARATDLEARVRDRVDAVRPARGDHGNQGDHGDQDGDGDGPGAPGTPADPEVPAPAPTS